jgi:hypothetical protein
MKLARLLTALALTTSLGAHASQGVSLASGFTDFTAWTLYGSATAQNDTPGNGFTYSNLILTPPASGGVAGAGYAPAALMLDFNQAFAFDFHFFIPASANLRGDGMTFTLTETFHFDGEPVSPSLQILSGGSVAPLAYTETGLGDDIRDPNYQWYASLQYTPSGQDDNTGMLTGSISHLNLGSFSVSASVDFDALGLVGVPVFYCFTAGNGLATDGHFVTSAMPVPEPGSWAMILAGLGWLGMLAQRRRSR